MTRVRAIQCGVIVVAGCAAAVRMPRAFVDGFYGAHFFPWLQWRLTGVTNLVPFAVLDVVIIVAVAALGWGAVAVARSGRGRRARTFWRWEWRFATVLALVYLMFLGVWGLNYQRQPLAERLDFAAERVSPASVQAFAEAALREVVRHRTALGEGPLAPQARQQVGAGLADAFQQTVRLLDVPGPVRPGVPKLTLLDIQYTRAGVSGMTDPLFLETFVASNLLPHELPVVVGHEWGHLAGFARESEASFFGWLVCARGDERARYSGWLTMLLRALPALDRDSRRDLVARLPVAVRNDLEASRRRDERDLVRFVTEVSQKTYDRYLKANRVPSGIRNYGEVLQLAVGTRFGPEWTPVRR